MDFMNDEMSSCKISVQIKVLSIVVDSCVMCGLGASHEGGAVECEGQDTMAIIYVYVNLPGSSYKLLTDADIHSVQAIRQKAT